MQGEKKRKAVALAAKQNGSKTEANPKQGESEREKEREKEGEKENEIESESYTHARKQYGEYNNVLLTDEEYSTLDSELPELSRRIEYLSGYLAKTGKTYDSHFAVLRDWAREDAEKAKKNACGSFDLDEFFENAIARGMRT